MASNRPTGNWIDRALGFVAPEAGLRRLRARVASELLQRHYEAASPGRRTSAWNRSSGDVNAVMGQGIARMRDVARDVVRNNALGESVVDTIANHTVGWGIVAKPAKPNARLMEAWKRWAGTTACDADGRNDFYGLQHLVMRTVAESGEVLVRRRRRLTSDGLPLPLQIQVIDPDFIDTSRNQIINRQRAADGQTFEAGRIVHGVEFDVLGRRTAYYLFPEHPGGELVGGRGSASVRVPADGVQHIYRSMRPGQVRGVTWLAPVLLRLKDLDDFDDATLMKQKVAACLSVITSDVTGNSLPLGDPNDPTASAMVDSLEPGLIINAAPGRTVEVVNPAATGDYVEYTRSVERRIATGVGLAYEDMTGDYTNLPFSAARMSRLHHWAKVDKWRWQMLIPLFCDPVWMWAMEAAAIMGLAKVDLDSEGRPLLPEAEWTPPPPPMIDPANEALAYQRKIRTGLMTQSEAIRECGYDPKALLDEMAKDNKELDRLGLTLDSDARTRTQAGQPTVMAAAPASPAPADATPGPASPAPADATPAPADGNVGDQTPPTPATKKNGNGKAATK